MPQSVPSYFLLSVLLLIEGRTEQEQEQEQGRSHRQDGHRGA